MIEKKSLEELLNKINDLIKNSPVQDIQKNVRAVISSWFASHNLVTREEFDAQVEVLRRTQDKRHPLLYQQVRIAFGRPAMPARRAPMQIQLRQPLQRPQPPSL